MVSKDKKSESVQVVVRVRPMSKNELADGHKNCIECFCDVDKITITNFDQQGSIPKPFSFDAVYDVDAQQNTVYDEVAFPLVESMLQGYNCTIFAYGQTGCGKTHTMMGVP